MPDGTAFWLDGRAPIGLSPLVHEIEVDVAIVGAGMAGLHCALALRGSGLRVAVFEARHVGFQATAKSTAKITSQHGLRYASLIRDFGEERARIYANANQQALQAICGLCAEIGTDAALERRDALLYARDAREAKDLEDEARAATTLGLPARLEEAAQTPFPVEKVLRFTGQAQFDPAGYLQGLVGLLPDEVEVYEKSRVTAVETGQRLQLKVNGMTVGARQAVIATQLPTVPEGNFYAKAFPFAHPVAAARLADGADPDGMYKSAGDPSHSFRTAERDGDRWLIAAGNKFKPGDPGAQASAVEDLRGFIKEHFGISEPSHLWINEDFHAMDGAAFVGRAARSTPNLLVATGFDAWGITQGAVAGEILAATILDHEHPAAALFDATRLKPISGGPTLVREGARTGARLMRDKLWGRGSGEPEDLAPGEGAVISRGGESLAIRRDAERASARAVGGLHAYGLPRRLERHRPNLGLRLPRLALRRRRHGFVRPRDHAARAARRGA
jgi:glycine/D-amino acid oxidase-like deaminating enzyme